MKSILILLLVGYACADTTAGGVEYRIAKGSWSKDVDDAISQAKCPEGEGYSMTQCSCALYDGDRRGFRPCDGSVMRTDRHGEQVCVSFNQAWGAGVHSQAMCVRLFKMVSDGPGIAPTATCPEGFVMIGCNIHLEHSHQYRVENDADNNESFRLKGDYDANTCSARCPKGPLAAGSKYEPSHPDGPITITKDLSADVEGCSVYAMCYLADSASIPVLGFDAPIE